MDSTFVIDRVVELMKEMEENSDGDWYTMWNELKHRLYKYEPLNETTEPAEDGTPGSHNWESEDGLFS